MPQSMDSNGNNNQASALNFSLTPSAALPVSKDDQPDPLETVYDNLTADLPTMPLSKICQAIDMVKAATAEISSTLPAKASFAERNQALSALLAQRVAAINSQPTAATSAPSSKTTVSEEQPMAAIDDTEVLSPEVLSPEVPPSEILASMEEQLLREAFPPPTDAESDFPWIPSAQEIKRVGASIGLDDDFYKEVANIQAHSDTATTAKLRPIPKIRPRTA